MSYIIVHLGYGGLNAYGDASARRSNESSEEIEVWVDNAGSDVVGYAGTSYGYDIAWGILTGGEEFYNNNVIDDGNKCLRNATLHESGILGSDYIYGRFNHTSGTIYICFLCGQTGGCTQGYDTYNGSAHSEWVIVGRLSNPTYNPHSDPTISLNTSSWISKAGASRSINYSYTTDGHSAIIYYNINNSSDWPSIDNLPRWFRFRYY